MESDKKFWATLANFGSKFVNIPEETVYKYERLLGGGAWSQIDLVYNDLEDKAQKTPFYIAGLKPIQVAAFDLPAYVDARRELSRDDWLDLVVRTIGLEPTEYDLRGKLVALTRLIPMVERNYNLIELGPWGTGKSFVYRESNPNAILISGGKVTVPQLFVNMSSGPGRSSRHLGRCRLRRGRRPPDGGLDCRQHAEGLHGVRVICPRQGRDPGRGLGRLRREHLEAS